MLQENEQLKHTHRWTGSAEIVSTPDGTHAHSYTHAPMHVCAHTHMPTNHTHVCTPAYMCTHSHLHTCSH